MSRRRLENSLYCPRCPNAGPLIRHGSFFRSSEQKWIRRFKCRSCQKTFSKATFALEVNQKKRQFNETLYFLLCSGLSQRRLSLLLGLHRITVARKLKFLSIKARINQEKYLRQFFLNPIDRVQFDEMETHEHTKLKPVSIPLAVCEKTRKILSFKAAVMPAKGLLAKKSRKKYGLRKDERPAAALRVLNEISPYLSERPIVTSDQNPKYPGWIPNNWRHLTIKGQRGCVVGQGELKKVRFDPLFSLNHTCAMIRANVNRLFRKTWCTTKKLEALEDHLWLYMDFHNRVLTS